MFFFTSFRMRVSALWNLVVASIRLRIAAFRQLIVDLMERRNPLRERMANASHRLRTCATGHLTPLTAATSMGDLIDFVDDPKDLTEELVDRALTQTSAEYMIMGVQRSGMTPAFLQRQLLHFSCCAVCKEMVVRHVVADWESSKLSRALIAVAREEDPEGLERLARKTSDKYLRYH